MDVPSLSSSDESAETSGKLSGIEPLNNSDSLLFNTAHSNEEDTSGAAKQNSQDCNLSSQQLGGQVIYWRTMASVPGGPPMASGAAESDPQLDRDQQEVRVQGVRLHGARMQLFREQPMAGSPDGAANGNPHVPSKAPPPDVVQSQSEARHMQNLCQADSGSPMEARQRQVLAREDGQSPGSAGMQAGLDISNQLVAPLHGINYPSNQPDMLGLDPEGQNIHDQSGPSSWPGLIPERFRAKNHGTRSLDPNMDGSLAGQSHTNELRTVSLSAGHEGASSERQIAPTANGNLGTGYITGNIQIMMPEENNSLIVEDSIPVQQKEDQATLAVDDMLACEGQRSQVESPESEMYGDPSNLDPSQEFVPLENDEPEGAGSSSPSPSNDDLDLAYEDNTEVDQDVILQPEADQTSYDENSEGRGQLANSRVSAFQPIAAGFGNQASNANRLGNNNSAPIYIPPRTIPLTFNPSSLLASGGYHDNSAQDHNGLNGGIQMQQQASGFSRQSQCQAVDIVQGNGSTKPEEDQLLSDLHGHSAQAVATESSQNQNSALSQVNLSQGHKDSHLTGQDTSKRDHQGQGHTHQEEGQVQHEDESAEGAVGGTDVNMGRPAKSQQAKQMPDTQHKLALSQVNNSRPQRSTGVMAQGQGQESQTKQVSVTKSKSSTEPGTNAGKQHTRSVSKIPKTQSTQSRRTKIRTLPPKSSSIGTTSGKHPGAKAKSRSPLSNQGRTDSNRREQCDATNQSRASTDAKSPNRQPPQRQAPSGGDSSTVTANQGQSQRNQYQVQDGHSQGQVGQAEGHGSFELQQAINGGQYMLPDPQCTSSVIRQQGMYLDSRLTQLPSHGDHNRDCTDGFMRPNPIGETDTGVRPPQGLQTAGVTTTAAATTTATTNNTTNVMLPIRQQSMNVSGLNTQLSSTTSGMVSRDGDETSSLSSQPAGRQAGAQHVHQNSSYNYFSRTHDQVFSREVPGTSEASNQINLPPVAVQSQQMAARVASPIYPSNPVHTNTQSHQTMHQFAQPLNLYYQSMDSSQADSAPNMHTSSKQDPYMCWDPTLELSPISRASGATDRIQTTAQTSPGASSNRDVPNNTSFMSAASERQQQQQSDHGTTNTDVIQMEQLRGQIRNMLKLTSQAIPDVSNYDQLGDERATPIQMESGAANALLTRYRKTLSELAPELSGILNQSHYLSANAGGASSQLTDVATLRADNQALKEALEKERFRRKHCERQIQELQNHTMELQQQLAVAVSTDRKKDLMIEQLDKALAQVVESWKKKEAEKQQLIDKLQKENKEMKEKQKQQQELQERFEKELTETIDELSKEQQRARLHEEQQHKELETQKMEVKRLSELLESEHQKALLLESDKSRLMEEKDVLKQKYLELSHKHKEDKENWEEREKEYQQKLEEMAESHTADLEKERCKFVEQSEKVAELERELMTLKTELQKLELELESSHREKESLKVQMGLLEAKSESQLRKLEADLQSEFEKRLSERLEEERKEAATREDEARERHRRQVLELTQRHSQETEMLMQRHQGDIWRCEDTWKREVRDRDDKIELLQQEIEDLKASNKRLEQQRTEMTAQLQSMMQAHCDEALRLLQIGNHDLANSPLKQSLFRYNVSTTQDFSNSLMSSVNSQPVAVTTSTTTTNLSTSVLDAVSEADNNKASVERYLQSMNQPQEHQSTGDSSDQTPALDSSHHNDFQPLSETMNSSMTSDLTQIAFGELYPNNGCVDNSFMSQVSMATTNATQLEALGRPQNSVIQNSAHTSVVQPLSTASTMSLPATTVTTPRLSTEQQPQSSSQTCLYYQGPRDSVATATQSLGALWPNQPTSHPETTNRNSLFTSSGPTIMLHAPIQRDNICVHSSSYANQSFSEGQGQVSHDSSHMTGQNKNDKFEHAQNTSLNTSINSDWGYPADGTSKNSFLSNLLRQHLSNSLTDSTCSQQQMAPPVSLSESPELDQVSQRFEQHESRQQELQHYIRMLLERSPGSTTDATRTNESMTTDSSETAPKKPVTKTVAFSKTTVLGPHGGAAPGGPGTVAMDQADKRGQQQRLVEGLGSLSSHQVNEISRLLELYSKQEGSGTSSHSGLQQHSSGLECQHNKTESLSSPSEPQVPVRDTKMHTPPSSTRDLVGRSSSSPVHEVKTHTSSPSRGSARNPSPTRPVVGQSRSKRNLEQNFNSQGQKQVIKIPTAAESSHNKQIPAKQTNVTTGNRASQSGARSTGSTSANAGPKKTEKKVAPSGGKQGKGTVWK